MRPIDQTHLTGKYKGKWVALRGNRRTVVASGKSVKSVLEAAKRKGCKQPILTRIPQSPAHFIGLA